MRRRRLPRCCRERFRSTCCWRCSTCCRSRRSTVETWSAACCRDRSREDSIGSSLDPEKSTFFIQSLVPAHAELYLLLSMVVPVPWLERVPTYKEQQETLKDKDLSSIGFLGYPLLQTADVAMYDARFVPVGDDQVAHLELAREVVRRFNNVFGADQKVLIEPQPLLTTFARLPGLDGDKKMSKSLGNTIHLSDMAEAVMNNVK